MSTTLETPETAIAKPAAQVIVLSTTDATIDGMEKRMLPVRIAGIADKAGRELAHKYKMECVKARTAIAAAHKEQKAPHWELCKQLDNEKARLTARVESIEGHLVSQLDAIAKEEALAKQEAENKTYAIRLELLTAAGGQCRESELRAMTDAEFQFICEQATIATQKRKEREAEEAAAELERKRLAAEEAERNRVEAKRLADERAEFQRQQAEAAAETARLKAIEDEKLASERQALESQRQEQARKEAELKAEQDRLAAIETQRLQALEQQRVAAEAAERARVETEQRLAREALVKEAQRVAEEAAAKRVEELKPAKAKLAALQHALLNLPTPTISPDVDAKVLAAINTAAETIRLIAKGMA